MKSPSNPYIGPRAFLESERLYGRDRELADLMDLLIAERIVLLYSPSGAGKSSLLQAGLIPAMKARGFTVPRVIRVNATPPAGAVDNRYAVSMMASLHLEGQPADANPGPLTLNHYLDPDPKGELLIFDQFEEILTTDPVNFDAKRRFFQQIGEALRSKGRWALFSMREDFLAGLDPYLRYVPTRLSNTFRLGLLSYESSLEAIREPAAKVGVTFLDEAVQQIADDLRKVNVPKPDGSVSVELGEFIEPVQLQVVCLRRWEDLPEGSREIAKSAQPQIGSTALADYYADTVAKAGKGTGASERAIRDWFEDRLITKLRTRGQVLMGPQESEGLSNQAIQPLLEAYLVRSDQRLGSVWLELAHDRLIEPVRSSNEAWRKLNLSPLQREAELWSDQGRPSDRLLGKESLASAEEWARTNKLNETEQDFLSASREAEQRRLAVEERRLKDIRIARILKAGAALLALLLVAAVWAFIDARKSQRAALDAAAQASQALAEYDLSEVPVLVDGGQMAQASAYLARALRGNPSSPRGRSWAAAFLSRGALIIPSQEVDHQSPITRLVLSGDGTRMLTTYDRGSSRVWNLKTGQPAGPAFAGSSEAELNRDGTLAVLWNSVSADDSSGHVIDVATGKELGRAPGSKTGLLSTAVGDVVFGKNTRQVFTRAETGIQLWDIDAQKAVRAPHIPGKIQYAAFNADRSVVLILLEHSALVWRVSDTSGGNLPETDFTSPVSTGALSPDGSLVAIVSGNNVLLWNIASGARPTLSASADADTVGFTGDGQHVVAVGKPSVRLWNAKTAQPESLWRTESRVDFRSGQQVFVEESDEDILLRDVQTFQPVARALTRGRVDNWALSADGNMLATAAGGRTQAEVWDLTPASSLPQASDDEKRSATPVQTLNAAQINSLVAGWQNKPGPVFTDGVLSQDGSKVLLMKKALATVDEPPEVRDAKTGALLAQIRVGGAAGTQQGTTFTGALSQDGKFAAVARSTGDAEVFDLTRQQPVGQPWTDMPGILALTFSRDGSHLIMGSSDRVARVWYVPLGSAVGDPVIHGGPVTQIVLSADGNRVLSTSGNSVSEWDLYLGSGSGTDGSALADLAEAAGGMRLTPGSSAAEMIPLAQRWSLVQNLAGHLSGLDPRVAAAIARFPTAPSQKR